MTGFTVRRKVRFRKERGKHSEAKSPENPRPVSRAARMLALAYYVERLVEGGAVKDYAQVARELGITRARLTQIMSLLGLPVERQEAILTGNLAISERRMRLQLQSIVGPDELDHNFMIS